MDGRMELGQLATPAQAARLEDLLWGKPEFVGAMLPAKNWDVDIAAAKAALEAKRVPPGIRALGEAMKKSHAPGNKMFAKWSKAYDSIGKLPKPKRVFQSNLSACYVAGCNCGLPKGKP
jgi:hypothetical protein